MSDESFLLVSLKDDQAKKLAQVVNNDTCRKLLEELSHGKATETELAKKLKLPLSTVHYNLSNLTKFNLIKVDEFHYSEKGKEVNHYSLANKFIIIAPKGAKIDSFRDKLKKILPAGLISVAAAGIIGFMGKLQSSTFGADISMKAAPRMMEAANIVADEAAPMMADAGVQIMADEVIVKTATAFPWANAGLFFLIGAIFAILTYLVIDSLRRRK